MPRRKNLDRCEAAHDVFESELALRDERIASQKAIAAEHWLAHDNVHIELARSLSDYKRESNEWRASLADLRNTFLAKSEFSAQHNALRSELLGEIKPLEEKLGTAREWQTARDARERGVTQTLTTQRAILLIVGSIVGTMFAIASLTTLITSVTQ